MLSVLNILDHHVVSKYTLTGAGGGQEGIAGDLPAEQHQRRKRKRNVCEAGPSASGLNPLLNWASTLTIFFCSKCYLSFFCPAERMAPLLQTMSFMKNS